MATKKKTPKQNDKEMQELVAMAKAGMTPEEIARIEESKRAELRGAAINPNGDPVVVIPRIMYDKMMQAAERLGAEPSQMVCICIQTFLDEQKRFDEDARAREQAWQADKGYI